MQARCPIWGLRTSSARVRFASLLNSREQTTGSCPPGNFLLRIVRIFFKCFKRSRERRPGSWPLGNPPIELFCCCIFSNISQQFSKKRLEVVSNCFISLVKELQNNFKRHIDHFFSKFVFFRKIFLPCKILFFVQVFLAIWIISLKS